MLGCNTLMVKKLKSKQKYELAFNSRQSFYIL